MTDPMPEPTDRSPSSGGRRITRGAAVALAVTAVLAVIGSVALVLGLQGTPASSQPAAAGVSSASASAGAPASTSAGSPASAPTRSTSTPSTTPSAAKDDAGIGDFLEASEPTSMAIPSIGVRSQHFVPLSVQRDGTISVPGTAQEVGLYDAGPTPGQLGPSVLAAHVDTPSGVPGIFHELRRVRAGDLVEVSRRDGSHLTFTVDRVAAYRKTQFPTELVYRGDFTRAEIRLVTCGGPTDSRNEYRDNVVVFGHLTSAQ